MSVSYEDPEGFEPTPEEPDYRKRRIIALGILLLLALLLIWGIVSLFRAIGGGNDENNDPAANASTSTSAEPFSDFSERASDGPSDESSDKASDSASDDASADSSESADPAASESASADASESADPAASESADPNESASPSAEPTASETPATVAACSAADMQVSLTADKANYGAGQNPAMAITYTNTSGNPCDIGGEGQNIDINITSGPAQVYNFAQCNNAAEPAAELVAGASGTKVITWDRSLNALGCGTTQTIKPGYYWATATVNGVTSEPTRIIVTG